jgi:hypothetical protein
MMSRQQQKTVLVRATAQYRLQDLAAVSVQPALICNEKPLTIIMDLSMIQAISEVEVARLMSTPTYLCGRARWRKGESAERQENRSFFALGHMVKNPMTVILQRMEGCLRCVIGSNVHTGWPFWVSLFSSK